MLSVQTPITSQEFREELLDPRSEFYKEFYAESRKAKKTELLDIEACELIARIDQALRDDEDSDYIDRAHHRAEIVNKYRRLIDEYNRRIQEFTQLQKNSNHTITLPILMDAFANRYASLKLTQKAFEFTKQSLGLTQRDWIKHKKNLARHLHKPMKVTLPDGSHLNILDSEGNPLSLLGTHNPESKEIKTRLAARKLPTETLQFVPEVNTAYEMRVKQIKLETSDSVEAEILARSQARNEMHLVNRAMNNILINLMPGFQALRKTSEGFNAFIEQQRSATKQGIFKIFSDIATTLIDLPDIINGMTDMDDRSITHRAQLDYLTMEGLEHQAAIDNIMQKIQLLSHDQVWSTAWYEDLRQKAFPFAEPQVEFPAGLRFW